MANEFFGYSLFTDQPEPLRTFNRTVVIRNMVADGYTERAKEYLEQFSDSDRSSILVLQLSITKEGMDSIKKRTINNINWRSIS